MKNSKSFPVLIVAAAFALGTAALPTITHAGESAAASSPHSKVRREATVLSVTGEITAIDATARKVTIKGPHGNAESFEVSPDVKNLAQAKVGDKVRLTYRVAVAATLIKGGGGMREMTESTGGATASPGQKPGAVAVNQTHIVADVVAVNKSESLVTLKGSDGHLVDVRVRDPKVLQEVKPGDQVEAMITESVAIKVHPVSTLAK